MKIEVINPRRPRKGGTRKSRARWFRSRRAARRNNPQVATLTALNPKGRYKWSAPILGALAATGGFMATRLLTRAILGEKDKGWVGYGLGILIAAIGAALAGWIGGRGVGTMVATGGATSLVVRGIGEAFPGRFKGLSAGPGLSCNDGAATDAALYGLGEYAASRIAPGQSAPAPAQAPNGARYQPAPGGMPYYQPAPAVAATSRTAPAFLVQSGVRQIPGPGMQLVRMADQRSTVTRAGTIPAARAAAVPSSALAAMASDLSEYAPRVYF